MVVICPKCGTGINRKEWDEVKNKWKEVEEEGVRRGRETAEYLKSQGWMGGKKDKECQHIDLEEKDKDYSENQFEG